MVLHNKFIGKKKYFNAVSNAQLKIINDEDI